MDKTATFYSNTLSGSNTMADLSVTIAGRFLSDAHYHLRPRVLEQEAVFIYTDGGTGKLIVQSAEYLARPGEGFLLFPGHRHEYRTVGRRWDLTWFHCRGPLLGMLRTRPGQACIPPTHFGEDGSVSAHVTTIVREFQEKTSHYAAVAGAHAKIVLIELSRRHERGGTDQHAEGARLVRQAAAYLRENIDRNVPIAELEERCHLSARHLTRLFQLHVGETPKQYALRAKLAEAKRLLYLTDLTVSEVAARVGMRDPYYFSRLFHRKTGQTPTGFRRLQGGLEPGKAQRESSH